MDVSAHGEVDEDEDVEFDEDGETEEDGVQDEASQTQSPVQSPLVQMNTKNLQKEERTEQKHDQQEKTQRDSCHRNDPKSSQCLLPISDTVHIFYIKCVIFSVSQMF